MIHNIPVQEYCQYLVARDIARLARTSRRMHCAVRALTDISLVRSFDVKATYLRVIFRAATWSRIGVTMKSTTLFEFDYYKPVQMIISPKSYNYTGLIALHIAMENIDGYVCMWATDGLVDCNIWWCGHRFANIYVFRSAGKIHFVKYIDEILRREMRIDCSLYNDAMQTRAVNALSGQYAHYARIDNVIRSATFAAILRVL